MYYRTYADYAGASCNVTTVLKSPNMEEVGRVIHAAEQMRRNEKSLTSGFW